MARMLAPSNPRSANSAIAALRIEARVSIERCCSALLRGRSRRAAVSLVFFAISLSINIVPNRLQSEESNLAAGSFSFEDEHWRFDVLVEGLCCVRKAALGVDTVVELHRDVEHHKIRGGDASA